MAINRYAGISPFTSEQGDVFFGRNKDIVELYEQILLEKQVLLYAKSGIGKTSLINAGVVPKLEKVEHFLPLKIRFFSFNENNPVKPLERIFDKLNNLENIDLKQNTILDQLSGNTPKTLWYYFKKIQLLKSDLKIILIFDQFEELFTYPEADILEFKNQFSEILKGEVPPDFIELFAKIRLENRELMNRQNLGLLNQIIEIKAVYIIRADRLSELNRLRDRIPNIQKSYYELLPLDLEQAQQAIENPAIKDDDENLKFASPKFKYKPESISKIVNFLTKKNTQSIETTQLQIICQKIEEVAIAKSQNKLTNQIVEIEKTDLPEFDEIFLNFYESSVKKIPLEYQEKAIILIEDNLIKNELRISLDKNLCTEYISETSLDILVYTHLLRAERNTVGGYSYELSHDTLVKPISDSRKKRKAIEAEIKAEQERKEELRIANEKAEKERIEREKERLEQEKERKRRRVTLRNFTEAFSRNRT